MVRIKSKPKKTNICKVCNEKKAMISIPDVCVVCLSSLTPEEYQKLKNEDYAGF